MRFFEMLKDRDRYRYPSSLYRNLGMSQHGDAVRSTPNAADNADDLLGYLSFGVSYPLRFLVRVRGV